MLVVTAVDSTDLEEHCWTAHFQDSSAHGAGAKGTDSKRQNWQDWLWGQPPRRPRKQRELSHTQAWHRLGLKEVRE